MERNILILTFPSDGVAFREHVMLAQERLGPWDSKAMLARVRQAYPDATATKASSAAVLEINAERWYVYRDGRALGRHGDGAWSDGDTVARALIGADGRYIEANDAAV